MTVFIHLSVQTQSALHMGAGLSSEHDHALFRRQENGTLVVPGTGIAGALRAHLTRLAPAMTRLEQQGYKIVCDALNPKTDGMSEQVCDCIVCHLMGDIYPGTTRTKEGEIKARASRLFVDNAVIDPAATHIRDGVGIDRVTGTASRPAHAKFDFETVPAGTPFDIWMELEAEDDRDRFLMALALDEWQRGRIRLGGRSSRGLGAIQVLGIKFWELDPQHNLDDLMLLLRGEVLRKMLPDTARVDLFEAPPRRYHAAYRSVPGSVQSWVEITFDLQAEGFFLANDATQAAALNFGHVSMQGLLPGSSLRGALRSQAERIARTIANHRSENERDFLDRCPASNPLSPRRRFDKVLRVDKFDLADQLFGNTHYGSRLIVDDLPLLGKPIWKPLDFLAIDRFTGGGAEGLKFDALALWQPCFAGRLYLEAPQPWELGWLLYTLKDVIDGRVPVGFGAAKGFGAVTLENFTFTIGRAYAEALPMQDIPLAETDDFFQTVTFRGWETLPETCFEDCCQAWINKVSGYRVDPLVANEDGTDYYWREREGELSIHQLYPKGDNLDALLHS